MHNVSTLDQLKADVAAARKTRDRVRTNALEALLARITNAEAVPASEAQKSYRLHMGVGSTEVARRTLSEEDIQQIIRDEMNELQDAIDGMSAHPSHPYVAELKQKADILEAYLRV